jgi:hypothetical protein
MVGQPIPRFINLSLLEKLNKLHKDFLKDVFAAVKRGTEGKRTFFNRNVNDGIVKNRLFIFSTIDPEIYLKLQRILDKKTDRFWPMDEFIDFMINWFIFSYDKGRVPKKMPLVRKYPRGKSFEQIKFESRFKKYFKNIM